MDQLIISLNLSAAILTLFYIVHLLATMISTRDLTDSGYMESYFDIKRSLLNQHVQRRA